MSASRTEILRLYKNLMLYSKSLNFTDVTYFKRRISEEFRRNKNLTKPEDINYAIKGKFYYKEDLWFKMFGLKQIQYIKHLPLNIFAFTPKVYKHTIDYSKVPKISEHELSEQFVRGGGPGGSAVNKNANCVVLTHIPSGTVIKCHISRCQDENRKLAREMLIEKLDEIMNGSESVVAQKKRLEEAKYKKVEYKKKKKAKLKEEWKKREGLA